MLTCFLPLLLFVLALAPAAAPLHAQETITTDANLYRSTDNGVTWHPFAKGLPEMVSSSVVLEDNGRILMATDYGGVYQLANGSDTWEPLNEGLPRSMYISAMAKRGDLMVLSTGNRRVYTSENGGENWTEYRPDLVGGYLQTFLFHDDDLLAGGSNGVWRSRDRGKSWTRIGKDGLQVNTLIHFEGKIYASRRDGILVSEDGGESWSYVYTGGAVGRLLEANGKLYGLDFSGGIVRSRDGRTWEKPLMALPGDHRNLPAALWWGYAPQVPKEMRVRGITETFRGWLLGMAAGC